MDRLTTIAVLRSMARLIGMYLSLNDAKDLYEKIVERSLKDSVSMAYHCEVAIREFYNHMPTLSIKET